MSEPLVLAVDLGGTNVRCALIGRRGRVAALRSIPIPKPSTPRNVVAAVAAALAELHGSAGRARALGLSWKGLVDNERGTSLHIGGFPGWRNVPVAKALSKALRIPAFLDNDAKCAALGEGWLGRAKAEPNYAFVIVGTGIGTGLVREGRLQRGATGRAGEWGHTVIEATDRTFRCDCGEWGHWEALAAGPSIGRRAARRLAQGDRSLAAHLKKQPGPVDGAWVGRAARKGVAGARAVIEETGTWLGLGLYNLVRAEDPALVVLGGGAAKDLRSAAARECARRLAVFGLRPPPIELTSLGDNAGLLGAASLAWEL